MRNGQWSAALSLWTTDLVYWWCLYCMQWSLLYRTSRMRVTAARTIPKQNIKSAGKMSCRRTLVKPPTLPLHFRFWGTQYWYSRSDMPLPFNHRTLKNEEMLWDHLKTQCVISIHTNALLWFACCCILMLSDHLDNTVSCQYSHNCPVIVCHLLCYDALRSLRQHSELSVFTQLPCYCVPLAVFSCCQIT